MSTPKSANSRRSKTSTPSASPWQRSASDPDSFLHKNHNELSLIAKNGGKKCLRKVRLSEMTDRKLHNFACKMSDASFWRSLFLHKDLIQALELSLGQIVRINTTNESKENNENNEHNDENNNNQENNNVYLSVWPLGSDSNELALASSEVTARLADTIDIEAADEPLQVVRKLSLINVDEDNEDNMELDEKFLSFILNDVVVHENDLIRIPYLGGIKNLRVRSFDSCLSSHMAALDIRERSDMSLGLIVRETEIELISSEIEKVTKPNLKDVIGGMERELNQLKSWLNQILNCASSAKGILIHGPSGVGKSLIGRHLDQLLAGTKLIHYSADQLFNEETKCFEQILTKTKPKSIIFVDDLDQICPANPKGERETQILIEFRAMMKKIGENVAVVAAVNDVNAVHSSLRRAQMFTRDLEISAPDRLGREQILRALLHPHKNTLSQEDLSLIASSTHAFVASDLQILIEESRNLLKNDEKLALSHIQSSFKKVKPSAMREVFVEVPNVSWADVGGMEELKLALKQAVEWPLKRAQDFKKFGINRPKGLLMYGPPGCSKTLIAQALATESGLNFLSIKGPELLSKWVGESERAVRELFRKARQVSPSLVFFDEIDALGGERGGNNRVGDRVLAQMLTEMDGIESLSDVTIVAATNRPDLIDDALMRPGRLDRLFYVPLPDASTRHQVLEVHTRNKPLNSDVDMDELVSETEGYSGAELAALCNEAALEAMQEEQCEQICMKHFHLALKQVRPRIRPEVLMIYEQYRKKREDVNTMDDLQ